MICSQTPASARVNFLILLGLIARSRFDPMLNFTGSHARDRLFTVERHRLGTGG